jgi:soluble lytic murein transglycosylase-like protein
MRGPVSSPASPADESVAMSGGAATPSEAKIVAPAAPAPRLPKLDREQENIARFISERYRVTVDATSEFVYHSYRAAKDTKLDPLLVLAVMSVESSFNPKAQSHAGAQGLMQVLTRVHVDKFLPFGGIPAAFDPVANIRVGSAILKEYLQREGTVEGALKSYVGAALAEHDGGYGLKVLNARERIAAAAAGRPIPNELVAARSPRPERETERNDAPVMLPVSAIIETRTPLQPSDDGSSQSVVVIHEATYLDASVSRVQAAAVGAASKAGGI